ncbi:hypothetical protein STEG23_024632, partial [Scotinomys teguina]
SLLLTTLVKEAPLTLGSDKFRASQLIKVLKIVDCEYSLKWDIYITYTNLFFQRLRGHKGR